MYQSIYVPTLTHGHEIWVMSKKVRSQIQAAEISYHRWPLHGWAQPYRQDEKLGHIKILTVEPLLLRVNRSQSRWLSSLVRMHSGHLFLHVFGHNHQGRDLGADPELIIEAIYLICFSLLPPKSLKDENNGWMNGLYIMLSSLCCWLQTPSVAYIQNVNTFRTVKHLHI